MKISYPIILASLILSTSTFGTVIFSDSFENPPDVVGNAPVGWSISSPGNIRVTDERASQGTQSLFMRDGNNRRMTQLTAVNIPDGNDDLVFSFDYAIDGTMESNDGLVGFRLDFGSGFETVLTDMGQADGYADVSPYTGTTITLPDAAGSDSAFFSYTVTVPASYYGSAASFSMEFLATSSTSNEDFFIDNIVVTAVPEPSIYALIFGTGTLVFIVVHRRRNQL